MSSKPGPFARLSAVEPSSPARSSIDATDFRGSCIPGAGSGQSGGEFSRRQRLREQITLAGIAAEHLQLGRLFRGLDAFGDGGQVQDLTEPDDRFGDRGALRSAVEFRGEAEVDLEDVDRQAGQVLQRGVAGAEVVERDADAVRTEAAQRGDAAGFADDRRFGDLQDEVARVDAGTGGLSRKRCNSILLMG